jgi:hypothetical protein
MERLVPEVPIGCDRECVRDPVMPSHGVPPHASRRQAARQSARHQYFPAKLGVKAPSIKPITKW